MIKPSGRSEAFFFFAARPWGIFGVVRLEPGWAREAHAWSVVPLNSGQEQMVAEAGAGRCGGAGFSPVLEALASKRWRLFSHGTRLLDAPGGSALFGAVLGGSPLRRSPTCQRAFESSLRGMIRTWSGRNEWGETLGGPNPELAKECPNVHFDVMCVRLRVSRSLPHGLTCCSLGWLLIGGDGLGRRSGMFVEVQIVQHAGYSVGGLAFLRSTMFEVCWVWACVGRPILIAFR